MSFIAFVFSSTRGCSIRVLFSCFFNLFHVEQFLSLSLSFITMTVLKNSEGKKIQRKILIWVCLLFSHDYIQFTIPSKINDIFFPAYHIFGYIISPCLSLVTLILIIWPRCCNFSTIREAFFKKDFFGESCWWALNPVPLSMKRCRHVIFPTSSQKREVSVRPLGKLNMYPPNLPGHRSLMSEFFLGNLDIKRKADLLLGGGAKENS